MNKKLFLIGTLFILMNRPSANAQSIGLNSANSGGGSATIGGGTSISFTIGEAVIETLENGIILNQGFQQLILDEDPLSIEDLRFSGIAMQQYNFLTWTTSREENNSHFTVMKSNNGRGFIEIGQVNTKALNGNSQSELSYSYKDVSAVKEVSYYKLKQVNADGTFHFSKVIELENNSKMITESVYPNPATDLIVLLKSDWLNGGGFNIYDINGKRVKSGRLTGNETMISLKAMVSGIYFMHVSNGSEVSSVYKFVKL